MDYNLLQFRTAQIREKFELVFALAKQKYGYDLPPTLLEFNIKGRMAGQAKRTKDGLYVVRLNQYMLMNDSFDHILNETVPHEIAHIVCMHNPVYGRNHNKGWKEVAKSLGCSGKRCHNEDVSFATRRKRSKFLYTDSSGRNVIVGDVKHKRIQNKGVIYHTETGIVDQLCSYSEL